jgi:general secretion pathway protein C
LALNARECSYLREIGGLDPDSKLQKRRGAFGSILLTWWVSMLLLLSRLSLIFACFMALPALAVDTGRDAVEVLGVITSAQPQQGIALVKAARDGKTVAARVGTAVGDDLVIAAVERDYVTFRSKGQLSKVRVGDAYEAPSPYTIKGGEGGIERKGNEVRVTSAYRDMIVKLNLGKVLMQAAAVPYYVNGQLAGFRLWEIDEGSVFQQAGFLDGDIVTAINGERLTDVGMTIRMLQAMRDEPRADVTIVRKGEEKTIAVIVD